MLSNAYFLAKFRFDTTENEPAKKLQNFANFPNFANPIHRSKLNAGRGGRRGRRARPGDRGRGCGPCAARRGRARRRGRRRDCRVVASFLAKFRQNVARFRLYRHRFLQENTRFAAFFKIYKIM